MRSVQSGRGSDGAIAAHFQRFADTSTEHTQRNNFKTSLSCLKFYIYISSTSASALLTKCKLYWSLCFMLSGETKATKRDIFAFKNGIFNFK